MKKNYLMLWLVWFSLLLNACTNTPSTNNVSEKQTTSIQTWDLQKKEIFEFKEKSFDFGVIKQSWGKVKHQFEFTYNGEQPIKITWVPTSCACTSAIIDNTNLKNGDKWVITVKFNPNLHEEPKGKFFKTISLITEPPQKDMPEIKIWVEIDLDLGEDAFELKADHDEDEEEEEEWLTSYTPITAEKFEEMRKEKDFILIDTHIPEQAHIEWTDLIIAYNEIDHNLEKLPKDKNTKIVLYCRSGSMSRAAAYILAEKWYKNVYDLIGWKNAYDSYIEENTGK